MWLGILIFGALHAPSSFAKLQVLTTLTDLKVIAAEVGGSLVEVESIVRGTQDPHAIEAKPSYMVKANKADLLIAIGLDLESAWLPSIVRGSRNPKVSMGSRGFLEVGPLVEPIEVYTGEISRRDGDVHPDGNPHVTLDPIRSGKIAVLIGDRMAELDPKNSETYKTNAKKLQSRLEEKTTGWKLRLKAAQAHSVVTYHKTLSYFLERFGIRTLAMLEPKPGIPPTSKHLMTVIELLKSEKTPLVLIENFFDPSVVKKLKSTVTNLRSASVPVAVEGHREIKTLDDLYESLVKTIEGVN